MTNSKIKRLVRWPTRHPVARAAAVLAVSFGFGVSAWALITSSGDLALVSATEGTGVATAGGHVIQSSLTTQIGNGQGAAALALAIDHGDKLFQAKFNAADGIGARVGAGERFTRMPRADKTGAGEWATHTPARATGPNAQSCTGCHNQGGDDGAGEASDNVHRDANHTGRLNQQVTRNTPHLFGLGGQQKLAEEMTVDLQAIRTAGRTALGCGSSTTAGSTARALSSKGISFGTLTINHAAGTTGCTESLSPPVAGGANSVSADLVVRPYQWKGAVAFIRDFVRGAAHNELGMQGSELLGSPTVDPSTVDGDGDGVRNELFVGDITALTIYQAAQPRPTTKVELAGLGLIPALTAAETASINRGAPLFNSMGCNSCHVPSLVANDVIFREPSANANFRDAGNLFPNGRTYAQSQLDPARPLVFDITRDHVENATPVLANGQKLGDFTRDAQGHAIIALFGDLRRHDMGAGLAEEVDEQGTGASVFMTENLWGAGSSPPYLHDGRAASLTEAILEHGGEGQTSRNNFAAASLQNRQDVIAFLNNLVLFKNE
ncbi:MAG TPA: di-heme oxidoredictase family protein [Polyangia bacterium]|jgi:hypothetical protein|nr:di-heme oxidoredictase family protein [Polyangia bacterium]